MASGVSTICLPTDPFELCYRLNLSLQKKQAGNNSAIINNETVVILDELIEYKCISEKQHKNFLIKCMQSIKHE